MTDRTVNWARRWLHWKQSLTNYWGRGWWGPVLCDCHDGAKAGTETHRSRPAGAQSQNQAGAWWRVVRAGGDCWVAKWCVWQCFANSHLKEHNRLHKERQVFLNKDLTVKQAKVAFKTQQQKWQDGRRLLDLCGIWPHKNGTVNEIVTKRHYGSV